MTRKKQGAPQRLNSKNEMENNDKYTSLQSTDGELCQSYTIKRPDSSSEKSNDEEHSGTEMKKEIVKTDVSLEKASNHTDSCQKLLNFTQNFSFFNNGKESDANKHNDIDDSTWSSNWHKTSRTKSISHHLTSSSTNAFSDNQRQSGSNNVLTQEKPFSDRRKSDSSLVKNDESINRNPASGIKKVAEKLLDENFDLRNCFDRDMDSLKGIDLASLTAAHKFLMDAMRQQKQMYEQCTNNWMSVQQRSDNNCLSKSKAERYRWCVQGGEGQQKSSRSNNTNQSHVNSLKKSASMAGLGVTPVQDKLYSTVFTGASKFCCRDCGSPFNTLVDLTIHMNKTGHFRDTNIGNEKNTNKETSGSSSHKTKKRPVVEDDSQNEKVLTCMGCGHLFESLQDLSVHMIKTKHYENVPSLRMWSQKQTTQTDNVPEARKRSLPSMMHHKKSDANNIPPTIPQHQSFSRPPINIPPYMAGLNNPAAAAAYTSLLYSSPWLAAALPPSVLHSFYAGLPYPYLYPTGLMPGSLPPLPNPGPSLDEKDVKLSCTKCKESFSSLQHLSEHVAETSHFSELAPLTSLIGALGSPSVTSPKSSDTKDASSPKFCGTTATGKSSAPSLGINSSSNTPTTSTQSKNSHQDYIHESFDRGISASSRGFDIIGSLESTIRSAISKVESPRDEKEISPNHSTLFDPSNSGGFGSFFSSLVSSKGDRPALSSASGKPIQSSKNLSEKEESCIAKSAFVSSKPSLSVSNAANAAKNSSATISAAKVNTEPVRKDAPPCSKVSSPLDLTLKRDFAESDAKVSNQGFAENVNRTCKPDSSEPTHTPSSGEEVERYKESEFGLFSSFNRLSQTKTPLQCLNDNMQSFFAMMKPKLEAAIGHNGTKRSAISPPFTKTHNSSESYKPIMLPNNSNSSTSDPLQEILKIVNSTDLTEPRLPAADIKYSRQSTLKRSSRESSVPVDEKKPKLSTLLHDLVIPKDESPASSVNPLQKIQDLVEKKLNHSHIKRSGVVEKNGPQRSVSPDVSSNSYLHSLLAIGIGSKGSIKASDFSTPFRNKYSTNQFSQRNGFHSALSNKPATSNFSDTSNLKSQSKSVDDGSADDEFSLEDLKLEATFARLFASGVPASDKEIGRHLDLTSDKVNIWFSKMTREFQSRGQLPFLRCHDNGVRKQMELLCRRCGMVFDTAEQFSSHVNEHFNEKRLQEAECKRRQEAPSSPGIRTKCTIQGAVCIGPYKSFKRAMSHHSGDEDEKNDPETLNLLYRPRCTDETSSNDDITVSS